jgi:regulator of replication initiation timing
MPWEKKKENGKWCIYKIGENKPIGTCHDTEAEANAQLAALHANEKNMSASLELDSEIFAVGKWNGWEFSETDLKAMAAAFSELGDNMRVPLKFGHNDEQPMTDGQPALGWVSKVWYESGKLMARFTDLPQIVYDAFKKKLYRNVSVELELDVAYKGNNFPFVLSGIALLGADIPAVNTLKDLTHYLSRGAAFSAGRKVVFSAIAGKQKTGGNIMDISELTQKVADLTVAQSALVTENAQLKATVAQFTAKAKADEEAAAKASIASKRAEVTGILEDGVKSEAITPAQREQFTKLMRVDDDVAVLAIDIAEVKALTANGKKQFSKEQGKRGNSNDDTGLPVAQRVMDGINALINGKEAKDFFTAQQMLFSRNPALAKEYANANDA